VKYLLDAETLGYIFALFTGSFFGLSDVFVRAAAVKLKPLQNVFVSLLVGTPMLWIFALAHGPPYLNLDAAILYVAAGLLNFVLGRLLFYTAITYVGATTASIVTSPTVVVSSFFAWFFLGESLTPIQLVGVFLVALAVYMVSFKPSGEALHGGKTSIGVAAGLTATVVFAVTSILVRSAAGYMHGDPIYGVSISYTSALPVVLVLNRNDINPRSMPHRYLRYMVAAAVTVTLAQLSRYVAFQLTTVAEASVIILLFPFFTLLFTLPLKEETKEKPKPIHLLATLLAITGIILTNYMK